MSENYGHAMPSWFKVLESRKPGHIFSDLLQKSFRERLIIVIPRAWMVIPIQEHLFLVVPDPGEKVLGKQKTGKGARRGYLFLKIPPIYGLFNLYRTIVGLVIKIKWENYWSAKYYLWGYLFTQILNRLTNDNNCNDECQTCEQTRLSAHFHPHGGNSLRSRETVLSSPYTLLFTLQGNNADNIIGGKLT